jgi:alkylation response protein AidB-like acyl-CoA dehydrogenase
MEKTGKKRNHFADLKRINMNPVPHPSTFIDSQSVNVIRRYVAEAEQMRCLHPEQLALIYHSRWFNLYVPGRYGGLDLPLPEGLRIEEALAWTDGSVGWTVTLCSGANWFIGFLQPGIAATLFSSEKVCFAGSGRPSGIATIINNDEFEISGSWQYATGAAHATAFTANCQVEKDGHFLQHEDGTPVVAAFIFLRSEVFITDDWKGVGMIATSSNRFEVNRLRVNKNRLFEIVENKAVLPDKIYQYPFLQFAESTLAVNISGMAIHFMDLFEQNLKERKTGDHFTDDRRHSLFLRYEAARNQQQEARDRFYQTLQSSWDEWDKNKHFDTNTIKKVSQASRHLAAASRQAVDELFPFCGLIASDPSSQINRVWRNLHTACLHPLLLQ